MPQRSGTHKKVIKGLHQTKISLRKNVLHKQEAEKQKLQKGLRN
jgi:hypothetical protein